MNRTHMTLAGGAAAAAIVAAIGAWALGGAAVTRVIAAPLGLTEASFQVTLGGPLWRDRTLRDGEGTPDIAYVTSDERLTITAAGRDGARVGAIGYRVDGGPVRGLEACAAPFCPRSATVTTTPALRRLGAGTHRLVVVVRGLGAEQVATATLVVTVGDRLPPVREGEPVATTAAPAPAAGVAALRRRTRAIVAREIRSGVLRGVIGAAAPRFVQIGELRAAGTAIGATALLALPVPLRAVRATVPGYVPAAGGYRSRPVRFTATRLRDLLVDVDLRSNRVIAVQPGPRSQTSSWAQQPGPATPAVSAAADASRRAPALVRLSERGPEFLAYDGAPTFGGAARDWPVSLVFTGHASVGKVKRALAAVGFTRRGHARYLAYRTGPGSPRFDGDRGLKTACGTDGTDVHLRLYAPSATDSFADPEYGSVVVATAHLDRADGCATAPTLFGFSEEAERRVATIVAARLGWRVQRNRLALGNAEPYRRDTSDSAHVWWSDGRATLVNVP
ncbi:MAG: hypothetical protein QOD69_1747 [Solirubrobacteraceae bacterium]|nr:hypothetical protein [Solirubrobacteraceae bacterium]